jgi:hypothetical protein
MNTLNLMSKWLLIATSLVGVLTFWIVPWNPPDVAFAGACHCHHYKLQTAEAAAATAEQKAKMLGSFVTTVETNYSQFVKAGDPGYNRTDLRNAMTSLSTDATTVEKQASDVGKQVSSDAAHNSRDLSEVPALSSDTNRLSNDLHADEAAVGKLAPGQNRMELEIEFQRVLNTLSQLSGPLNTLQSMN